MDKSSDSVAVDLEQARSELQVVLGAGVNVSVAVARRAMTDLVYQHRLLVSRSSPSMLEHVLADPGNARFADAPTPDQPQRSSGELVAKAVGAMAAWARSGFALAGPETVKKRLDTCNACPHLTTPGDQVAYRLLPGGKARRSVCSRCGCAVSSKAKIAREICPDADPDNPGFTRWGDPVAAR